MVGEPMETYKNGTKDYDQGGTSARTRRYTGFHDASKFHHVDGDDKGEVIDTKNAIRQYRNDEIAASKLQPFARSVKKSKTYKNQRKAGDVGRRYHDYAILIVHYHKTGYVLSRELRNLVRELEVKVRRPYKQYINPVQFLTSGIDEKTGERIAFDQVGSWARSAYQVRNHCSESQCPRDFGLRIGTMYIQESPDFYCSLSEISSSMISGREGGTKIVHFVRNPFDMAVSNYFYHSQDPTPERWVYHDDPCEHRYEDGESLSAHVLPTLALSSMTTTTPETTQQHFDDIVKMCRSLFQSQRPMKKTSFFHHLLKLKTWDGLRLATAQMIVASGMANRFRAGGDILRMANNVIKFKQLQQSLSVPSSTEEEGRAHPNNIQVLTMSMDDFIADTAQNTMKFLDFVFGDDDVISKKKRWEASRQQQERYSKKKGRQHVTQTNSKNNKEVLRVKLKMDPYLGPILNLTEALVNEALLMRA